MTTPGKRSLRAGKPIRAYILLEVILAAGIFAVAGISLASALNTMANVYLKARTEAEVRLEMETRLAQARILPLTPMKERSEPDARGVVYEKEVSLLEITNDDKVVLTNLYRLSLRAFWKEGREDQEELAEIYVYQP
ncbi:MAG: hypothetical protein HC904_17195 [Blastochloris sp.]|nr:hypothetical protein [Blastochloris sp.]